MSRFDSPITAQRLGTRIIVASCFVAVLISAVPVSAAPPNSVSGTEVDGGGSQTNALNGRAASPQDASTNKGTSTQTDATDDASVQPGGVEESGPSLMYWRDEDGELVPLVYPFAKLEELYRASQQPAANLPPDFSLDKLVAHGEVSAARDGQLAGNTSNNAAAYAELDIELTVSAFRAGWIHVPLNFRRGHLRDIPDRYLPHGGQLLVRRGGPTGDERYHAWLYFDEPRTHVVRMSMRFPVERSGRESQLPLYGPLATISELRLRVPEPDAVPFSVQRMAELTGPLARIPLSDSSQPASVREAEAAASGGSLLHFHGTELSDVLHWRRATASQTDSDSEFIQVVGYITAQVDESGTLLSDVQLKITKAFGPLTSFPIRLPEGASVVDRALDDYTLEPLPASSMGNQWLVTLREASKSVELNFKTKFTPNQTRYDVATYDVVGAALQTGTVHVYASDTWRPYWNTSPLIRRLPTSLESSSPTDDVTSFAYQGQPCSLEVRVVDNDRRVTVEPVYHIDVDERQIHLKALFKCRVRGVPLTSINLETAGWTFDDVGPESLIDGLPAITEGTLRVPFTFAASGEFEFVVEAHRDLPPDDGPMGSYQRLQLSLLAPQADTVTPAIVVVSAAPGISLRPLEEQTGDSFLLIAVPPEIENKLGPWNESPLCFRRRGGSTVSSLTLDRARNQRQVYLTSSLELQELGRSRLLMRQTLDLQVRNAPLTAVRLGLPAQLWRNGSVQLLVNGATIQPSPAPAPNGPGMDNLDYDWGFVALPYPGMGTIQLEARLEIGIPFPLSTNPQRIAVPLVQVADVTTRRQTFHSALFAGWKLSLPVTSEWSLDESEPAMTGLAASTSSAFQQTELPLTIQLDQTATAAAAQSDSALAGSAVMVERAWIQTILSRLGRYDRAIYRLRGGNRTIRITVPDDLVPDSFHLVLDGELLPATPSNSDVDVVLTDDDDAGALSYHTLEVGYQLQNRQPVGRGRLRIPVIRGAGTVQQWFWQLELPAHEHLLAGPEDLTSANRWRWLGWGISREPQMTSAELEQWVSASQPRTMPIGANVYLYGGFNELSSLSIYTVRRSTCLLWTSSLVLLGGMLFSGLSRIKRTHALGTILLLLFGGAIWQPTVAGVVGQAAVFGLAGVVLVMLVQWYWQRLRTTATPWRAKEIHSEHFSLRETSSRVTPLTPSTFAKTSE